MLSKQLLTQFANDVFTPLRNGECVSCMFSAGGGKRTLLKFFLNDKNYIKSIFGASYEKTIFVYIDPDEISNVTSDSYLQLILDNLLLKLKEHNIDVQQPPNMKSPLILLKQYLDTISRLGWKTVLILNDFEFTLSLPVNIYLNLESIMSVDKSKIVYLFLSTMNLFSDEMLKKLHNLKYAVSRRIIYFPLFDKDETYALIDDIALQLKLTVPTSLKDILFECCGGHPQLLKYSIYHLHTACKVDLKSNVDYKKLLLEGEQLRIVCADIWNYFTDKEKSIINSIVTTAHCSSEYIDEFEYLKKLGIVQQCPENKCSVFGELFEEFVKRKLPKQKLMYNPDEKKLYFGHELCDDKFTHQEFKLLTYFLTHENEVITRDQVAEAIWGRLFHEKYSDWSIDKTISILRKKLDALGFPSEYLVTLKKRGFSFSNPI